MPRIESPTSFEGPIARALDLAHERVEPVIVPVPVYADDRGWSLMNQFQGVLGPEGQINFSVQHPNVIKAWHRHQKQTDLWLCLHGHIKVGVHRDRDARSWMVVIGQMRPAIVVIPPSLWHGAATVGIEPAGLLYYVTRAFDPAHPDEERRAFDSVPEFPWGVQFR